MLSVFISYRSDGGYLVATHISELLTQYGYRVLNTKNTPDFHSAIIKNKVLDPVKDSECFLLLLSKYSLNACNNKNDKLRREIETALDNYKDIIVIEDSRFMFPQDLPDSLKFLVNYHKKILLDMNKNNYEEIIPQLTSLCENCSNQVLHEKNNVPQEESKITNNSPFFLSLLKVVISLTFLSVVGYNLVNQSFLIVESPRSSTEKKDTEKLKNLNQFYSHNSIQINKKVVNIDDCVIHGNNNIINGSNNKIRGNNNIVRGNNYSIVGNRNIVYGSNRILKGNNNVVTGNNESIDGNNNIVHGSNQIIRGKNNVVKKQ